MQGCTLQAAYMIAIVEDPSFRSKDAARQVMRLPDEVRKCVVFLGRREIAASGVTKFVPEGTGFLLSYPSPSFENFEMTFLVTAKHVAKELEPDFETDSIPRPERPTMQKYLAGSGFTTKPTSLPTLPLCCGHPPNSPTVFLWGQICSSTLRSSSTRESEQAMKCT